MSSTSHHQPAGGAAAVLDGMRGQVGELAQTLWAARPAGELTGTVAAIESLKSALDALELDVIAELEATNAVKTEGWASTRDFATAVTGGHLGGGPSSSAWPPPWHRTPSRPSPRAWPTAGSRPSRPP